MKLTEEYRAFLKKKNEQPQEINKDMTHLRFLEQYKEKRELCTREVLTVITEIRQGRDPLLVKFLKGKI